MKSKSTIAGASCLTILVILCICLIPLGLAASYTLEYWLPSLVHHQVTTPFYLDVAVGLVFGWNILLPATVVTAVCDLINFPSGEENSEAAK